MNERPDLDRVLGTWLRAEAPPTGPAEMLGQVFAVTRTSRPLPTWRALLSVPPMRTQSTVLVGSPMLRLTGLAVVAVVLGLLALMGALLAGGHFTPTPETNLGIFEPARGRIVYRNGSHLEAVDPDAPSSPVVIEPAETSPWAMPPRVMPAGWSADGTKLAITDEEGGALYVMDRTGSLQQVAEYRRCCWLVPSAWLSPDGTERLGELDASGRLQIWDLDDKRLSRVIDTEHVESGTGEECCHPAMPVWSPDGSQVAYIWNKGGDDRTLAVGIVDLGSGASRELVSGWEGIRQLAWSPDGSRLLMVASRDAPDPSRYRNSLMEPQPANLYLVDIDDGEAHEVASGHYVAAAWSPDGTRVAAVDYQGQLIGDPPQPAPGRRELVVINADGSGGRRVLTTLNQPFRFTGVVWHPVPAP